MTSGVRSRSSTLQTSERIKKSWSKRDENVQSTSKADIREKKVMLSV